MAFCWKHGNLASAAVIISLGAVWCGLSQCRNSQRLQTIHHTALLAITAATHHQLILYALILTHQQIRSVESCCAVADWLAKMADMEIFFKHTMPWQFVCLAAATLLVSRVLVVYCVVWHDLWWFRVSNRVRNLVWCLLCQSVTSFTNTCWKRQSASLALMCSLCMCIVTSLQSFGSRRWLHTSNLLWWVVEKFTRWV